MRLGRNQLAANMGITVRTLDRYIHDGPDPIPSVLMSHSRRFDSDDVAAWLVRHSKGLTLKRARDTVTGKDRT